MDYRASVRHLLRGMAILAAAASCALALAGPRSSMASASSITIARQDEGPASYEAYCLFLASVSDVGTASNVSWASEGARRAVLAYLDTTGYGGWLSGRYGSEGSHDVAQAAAEYLTLMIGPSADEQDGVIVPATADATTFALGLAQALVSREGLEPQRAEANTAFVGEQGYWLFVSDPDGTEGSGTAPIWVTLGGPVAQVVEKVGAPTISKEVQEDSDGVWGRTADVHRGQDLPFRLTGTLPANFDAYAHYHYRFCDTLSEGLTLSKADDTTLAACIEIAVDGRPFVADGENLAVAYDGNELSVDFADLKSSYWSEAGITSETVITIGYQAHLNSRCHVGSLGNENAAMLVHTCDPVRERDGSTKEARTKVFCYGMELRKTAGGSGMPLPGAAFVLRPVDQDGDDSPQRPFVQADGSLGSEEHRFVTDQDGTALIKGIDEGIYELREVAVPDGYQQPSEGVVVEIASVRDDQGLTVSHLEAKVVSGRASIDAVSAEAGTATLLIENSATPDGPSRTPLAQTGVGPIAAVLVCLGLALMALAQVRDAAAS